MPTAVTDYLIDIFPVGHVFLPGHELVVKVHAPPADDNDYNDIQKTLPGENTLHFGPGTLTRLRLPIIPMSEVRSSRRPPGSARMHRRAAWRGASRITIPWTLRACLEARPHV